MALVPALTRVNDTSFITALSLNNAVIDNSLDVKLPDGGEFVVSGNSNTGAVLISETSVNANVIHTIGINDIQGVPTNELDIGISATNDIASISYSINDGANVVGGVVFDPNGGVIGDGRVNILGGDASTVSVGQGVRITGASTENVVITTSGGGQLVINGVNYVPVRVFNSSATPTAPINVNTGGDASLHQIYTFIGTVAGNVYRMNITYDISVESATSPADNVELYLTGNGVQLASFFTDNAGALGSNVLSRSLSMVFTDTNGGDIGVALSSSAITSTFNISVFYLSVENLGVPVAPSVGVLQTSIA